MGLELSKITFDCGNAGELAAFWAEALGWDIGPDDSEGFAVVGGPKRPRDCPSLMFIKVPEGKSAKNRCHLDLVAADREGEVGRLLRLGASRVHDKDEYGVVWTTLLDPEGNEFCVGAPHELPSGGQA